MKAFIFAIMLIVLVGCEPESIVRCRDEARQLRVGQYFGDFAERYSQYCYVVYATEDFTKYRVTNGGDAAAIYYFDIFFTTKHDTIVAIWSR